MMETVFCDDCGRLQEVVEKTEKQVPKDAVVGRGAAPFEGRLACGHDARWIGVR